MDGRDKPVGGRWRVLDGVLSQRDEHVGELPRDIDRARAAVAAGCLAARAAPTVGVAQSDPGGRVPTIAPDETSIGLGSAGVVSSQQAGERLPVARNPVGHPHPLVANAEFAFVGHVKPHETQPEGPFGDFYIWRDGSPSRPPNNWGSTFGGPAWTFHPQRGQWYLHLFAPQQPDLNWRNPAVVAAVLDSMEGWLRRGVSGFRLDVFNLYRAMHAFFSSP